MVHLPCFALSDDELVAAVAAFARARPDTPACHACLAAGLRISLSDARTAMNAVRLIGDDYYLVVGERCGFCHRDAATIQYSASDVPPLDRAA